MRRRFGAFVLDLDARQLLQDGTPVHLSPKAFDLLALLVAETPRAVHKNTIYDHLWPQTHVVAANLPILISEVRTALADDAREIIRTVHSHGYAFAAPIVDDSTDPVQTPAAALIMGDRVFELTKGENVIGRDVTASVRLIHPSVSRRHALLTIAGREATLVDLQSKNGTAVDNVSATRPLPLRDGSVVRFGTVEMIYRTDLAQSPTDSALQ